MYQHKWNIFSLFNNLNGNRQNYQIRRFKLYFPSLHSSWKSAPVVWATYFVFQGRTPKWRRPQAAGRLHDKERGPPFPGEKITKNLLELDERINCVSPQEVMRGMGRPSTGSSPSREESDFLPYRYSLRYEGGLNKEWWTFYHNINTITMALVICPALIPMVLYFWESSMCIRFFRENWFQKYYFRSASKPGWLTWGKRADMVTKGTGPTPRP